MQKNGFRVLLLTLILLFAAPLAAREVTILFTHDLHSMFRPHKALDEKGNVVSVGGYAQLYSAIVAARAAAPQQTILVDAGDFSSGSFFYTLFTTDCAELQLMALMGYDVTTLGNHEFDVGVEGLARALVAAKSSGQRVPEIVNANLKAAGNTPTIVQLKNSLNDYDVKEYTLLVRNGVRIGVFGLLGDNAVENAPMAAALTFENKLNAAKRVIKILREQERADLIICLSHSGTDDIKGKQEDVQLAQEVAGIDVIISGHSHTVLPEPLVVGRTVIASAGSHAAYLGTLTIDADSKALRDYRLIAIDAELPADNTVSAAIDSFGRKLYDSYFSALHKTINDTVVVSNYHLPRAADTVGVSLLGNLVADAFAATAKRALHIEQPVMAVVPFGTLRNDLYKGYTTEEDIFSILSLGVGPDGKAGHPLVCVYLTGKELTDLCEIDASLSPTMPDAQLFFAGLRYRYDPQRLFFTKVTQVWVANKDGRYELPDATKLYPVAASLYSAQMLGAVGKKTYGLLSLKPKDANGNYITDYEQHILRGSKNTELKEWIALSNYLHSLSENGQLAELPERYATPEQQKIIQSQPNVLIMIAKCFLFFGLLAVVVSLVSRRKKKTKTNPETHE